MVLYTCPGCGCRFLAHAAGPHPTAPYSSIRISRCGVYEFLGADDGSLHFVVSRKGSSKADHWLSALCLSAVKGKIHHLRHRESVLFYGRTDS